MNKDLKREIDRYINLIALAMKQVEKSYFTIKVAGTCKRKYRERVYCYELYHQMRCLQDKGDFGRFTFNAEIDKSGHAIIKYNFNPDMVIHQQGNMTNYIVMEVKTSKDVKGIIKDFNTIKCMLNCYEYQYGIFILIGSNKQWFLDNVLKKLKDERLVEHSKKIHLFFQEQFNSQIEKTTLYEEMTKDRL